MTYIATNLIFQLESFTDSNHCECGKTSLSAIRKLNTYPSESARAAPTIDSADLATWTKLKFQISEGRSTLLKP